jgi:ADP-heptose:LPS heptosyltransferase
MPDRVLVIRHGALGDIVLSFGPFAAIRARHAADRVTLLTTAPFAPLARRSPWFDEVLVDARPTFWDLAGLRRLRRQLAGFDMVYDLQTSRRSSTYHCLAGRPPWSGIARGASLPHANPRRDAMHTRERQRDQLARAGITVFPPPDLGWLAAAPAPGVPARFALLVPGAAPHRPEKRWPAERFAGLAHWLRRRDLVPVVVGTAAERDLAATILRDTPGLDLTGRTDLPALAAVAARAALAVGNDTGPMHVAAVMGAPSLVLFSGASDPALTAPRTVDGGWVGVLRARRLADLTLDQVAAALPDPRPVG